MNKCEMRPDLFKNEGMPPLVGLDTDATIYPTHRIYEYRYTNLNDCESFQVKYKGKWYSANSIDFNFLDSLQLAEV